MANITISTPFNIDLEFQLAPFMKRVIARAIDMAIICIYFYLIIDLIYPLFNLSEDVSVAAALFLVILPIMGYLLVTEILMNGQTPGKRLVGIKVIDKEGKEPTWGQYLIRWMLFIANIGLYTMPLYMAIFPAYMIMSLLLWHLPDIICMSVSAKMQRIGDLAAGTAVIDLSYKPNINETIYIPMDLADYVPMFPQVMKLTDRDLNGIRNLLDVAKPNKESVRYAAQIVAKIKKVLKIETELDGYDFLAQLLQDYNYIAGK